MKNETIYVVYGVYEEMVFARCTTLEKAQKAKALIEKEGFADIIDIIQEAMLIDAIKIGGKVIGL